MTIPGTKTNQRGNAIKRYVFFFAGSIKNVPSKKTDLPVYVITQNQIEETLQQ
jgi:hypothetical protein